MSEGPGREPEASDPHRAVAAEPAERVQVNAEPAPAQADTLTLSEAALVVGMLALVGGCVLVFYWPMLMRTAQLVAKQVGMG